VFSVTQIWVNYTNPFSVSQIRRNVRLDSNGEEVLDLSRSIRGMRCDDEILYRPGTMAVRKRLGISDIDAGSSDCSGLECVTQGIGVYDRPTSYVYQIALRAH
jgi:hypothetical protein